LKQRMDWDDNYILNAPPGAGPQRDNE